MAILREFRASRWTHGNRLFPDILRLQDECVVHIKRGWFSSDEESIAYQRIASVHVRLRLLFASILIESTGGTDPIQFHGLHKADARAANDLILQLQTKGTAAT
ncbi:MAG: PH domain-containing protein [Planctomycetes bacterium]|nr:PH domain-containing protein [Planctomycetota bacterium]